MGEIVAIDLGSTYLSLAIPGARQGDGFLVVPGCPACSVILDDTGQHRIPAVVAADRQGRLVVGSRAKRVAGASGTPICLVKRYLGEDRTFRLSPELVLRPDQLLTHLLRYLKDLAQERLGYDVDETVIAIPASWSLHSRRLTLEAAHQAGWRVVHFVPAPVAAALSSCDPCEPLQLMIYNLGGGCFEAAVLQSRAGMIQLISVQADHYLGGHDFDRLIADWILGQLLEQGYDLKLDETQATDSAICQSMLGLAEAAKIRLSSAEEAAITGLADHAGQPISLDLTITRVEFERIIGGQIDQTIGSCRRALNDVSAAISPEDLDDILIIGGSSKIPLVSRRLAEEFDRPPRSFLPDSCVALGTAILAGRMRQDHVAEDGRMTVASTTQTAPMPIQTPKADGGFLVLVREGTPLPHQVTFTFSICDSSGTLRVPIYEGQTYFGEISIQGLPPDLPAGSPVPLTLTIDENGSVECRAWLAARSLEGIIAEFGDACRTEHPIGPGITPTPSASEDPEFRTLREQAQQGDLALEALLEQAHQAAQRQDWDSAINVLSQGVATAAPVRNRVSHSDLAQSLDNRALFCGSEVGRSNIEIQTQLNRPREALATAGPDYHSLFRQNLAVCLANRGAIKMNHAIEEMNRGNLTEMEASERDLRGALQLDPSNSEIQRLLSQTRCGLLLGRAKWAAEHQDWSSAIDCLREGFATAATGQPSVFRENLASCLLNRAIARANQAVEKWNLGDQTNRLASDLLASERDLLEAVQLDPSNAEIKTQLHRLRRVVSDFERARKPPHKHSDEGVTIHKPESPRWWGRFLHRRKDKPICQLPDRSARETDASPEHQGRGAPARRGTPEFPGARVDSVHFSVTSPSVVTPGASFVLNVWAHLEAQRQEVITRAREAAGSGEISIQSKGPLRLARGIILTVRVRLDDLLVADPEDTILWEGEVGNATFGVRVPADAREGDRPGLAMIYLDGLLIAKIHFSLLVGQRAERDTDLPLRMEYHRKAFASYASQDRDEVLGRIQGILKAAPGLELFLDVLNLRSGQDWEQELWKQIPASDVFYLFWSENAKRSEWVEKEWRCALQTKGLEFIDPVPLVSPEQVPPPPELATKHFNDWILAFRSGRRVTRDAESM